jgi:hypothetical protein
MNGWGVANIYPGQAWFANRKYFEPDRARMIPAAVKPLILLRNLGL